jgi:hypothetical protein
MFKRRSNLGLAVIATYAVLTVGCAAWKSGTVTHKVTQAQHSFQSVVSAFQDAEIAAHDQKDANGAPFISDDLHVQIQQGIKKVALAGVDLDTFLATTPPAAAIKVKLTNLYALVDSLDKNGLSGVKNPTKKAELEIALNQVKALIDTALIQVQ